MDDRISALTSQIGSLELELQAEMARRRADLKYGIESGQAVFDQEILRRHRESQIPLWTYIRSARVAVALTAPVIYSLIIPVVILDIFVSLYQFVCFPIYGIETVNRRDFIVFDRHHLAYLNSLEKINCAYCSYANGVISYAYETASLTEKKWCPIKHARRLALSHQRYSKFADFGDADGYKQRLEHSTSED